jgi:hypothetical protein
MKKLEVDGHVYFVKYVFGELIVLQNEKSCFLYERGRGIFGEVKKCTPPPVFIKHINGTLSFMGNLFKVVQKTPENGKTVATLKLGKTQMFFHINEKTGELLKVSFPMFD